MCILQTHEFDDSAGWCYMYIDWIWNGSRGQHTSGSGLHLEYLRITPASTNDWAILRMDRTPMSLPLLQIKVTFLHLANLMCFQG